MGDQHLDSFWASVDGVSAAWVSSVGSLCLVLPPSETLLCEASRTPAVRALLSSTGKGHSAGETGFTGKIPSDGAVCLHFNLIHSQTSPLCGHALLQPFCMSPSLLLPTVCVSPHCCFPWVPLSPSPWKFPEVGEAVLFHSSYTLAGWYVPHTPLVLVAWINKQTHSCLQCFEQ